MPCSCAPLADLQSVHRVALLWQHSANAKCQRVLELDSTVQGTDVLSDDVVATYIVDGPAGLVHLMLVARHAADGQQQQQRAGVVLQLLTDRVSSLRLHVRQVDHRAADKEQKNSRCIIYFSSGRIHGPCLRAVVNTAREHGCHFRHPSCKCDVTNNSACRSRWPVFTGVQK